jgi:hypothetical protein
LSKSGLDLEMKSQNILLAVTTAVASLTITVAAKADTVQARCDVYPKGSDQATSSGLCTFSQRQGAVGIQLKNGTRYDLTPVGNQPGNYVDQNGRAAYRQARLGDKGQIYRLATQSIYVYWDPAPFAQQGTAPAPSAPAPSTQSVSQTPAPLTYMTPVNANAIRVQITDGEFKFRGTLNRTSGNMFVGEDSQVRVMYDKGTSRVVVINKVTGTEFYNYIFSTAKEGNL